MESKSDGRQSIGCTSKKGRRQEEMMVHSSFHLSAAVCLALAVSAAPAAAQTAGGAVNLSGGKGKIGVLTDIPGPTARANGKGSGIPGGMGPEDFGNRPNPQVHPAGYQREPAI